MAWRLRFDGVNDRCTFGSTISLDLSSAYTFEFKGIVNALPGGTGLSGLIGRNGTPAGFSITPSGALAGYTAGQKRYESSADFIIVGENHAYRIEHDSDGALRFYRDGSLISSSTFTFSTVAAPLAVLGSANGSSLFLSADIEYIELIGPANAQKWDATLSVGTGSTLPTTSGANNATLVNFTVPDCWIFYDDGGATTSTVSYDLGVFGFAVESTVTAPAVTASADYDIGALDFAVSANVTAPTVTASLDYDLGAFGFAASATASVPAVQSAIDYSIGDFGFAVIAEATSENNTASISYDLGAFGFAVDAASTVPVVSAAAAYDLGAFGFNVVADIATAPTASILYDLGDFGFAASAQVIPPPVEASSVYDLGSFGFSVFATQPTGLRPQAGATLKFNELSRKVAAIELSRSVRYTELSRKVRG